MPTCTRGISADDLNALPVHWLSDLVSVREVALVRLSTETLILVIKVSMVAFEIWIWRRMLKISRKNKGAVLEEVKEERSMLSTVWQQKHRWRGHMLRNEVSLQEIIEGRKQSILG